ncbi:MAG: hypothetical protein IKT14_03415 [Clostridiales bacterium]|nr:hypothetical protein [Clostridiales bacterium]MBR6484046.1 hypothetical protein [Clostridiales bacterium]
MQKEQNENNTFPGISEEFKRDEKEDSSLTDELEEAAKEEAEAAKEEDGVQKESSEDNPEEGQGEEKGKFDAGTFAMDYIRNMYVYCAFLKSKGHATLSDMMFKDAMSIYLAATLASWSMGRDRFVRYLEDGFYSSGRIIEYLKLIENIGIVNDLTETVKIMTFRMHKMYKSSLKTMRSKIAEAYEEAYM